MDGTPFGRYQLVELLGRGGMGEVWRAFDSATERVVALKVLPTHLAEDKKYQQRFRREALAAAGLNEPHVVPIHDFGEIDGRLYVNMRLVEGQDLQTLLDNGPLEPARAVGIIDQLASALQAAHRIGLIHRDVKPSNVLIAEDDFAYLIDFGIAQVADETRLTDTKVTVGSWAYVAPERFRTGATVDARADVYSLACVLHQALTAQPPFDGNSLERLVTAHMFEPPPKPSQLRAGVPAAIDHVIATGMAKEPDQRYATTKELARAAVAALAAQSRAGGARHGGTRPRERPAQLALRYVARTDRGLDAPVNEDSVYAGPRLLAVADGIGSPNGGDLASMLAINTLAGLDDTEPGADVLDRLDAAFWRARIAINISARRDAECAEMGTTLTAILFAGKKFGLAHIGGSRAYRLRAGELTQITTDQARWLRGDEVPGLTMREATAGDRYLLCTRGLSDFVDDHIIWQTLQEGDITSSANKLIELALRGGGTQNVTVVVADVIQV